MPRSPLFIPIAVLLGALLAIASEEPEVPANPVSAGGEPVEPGAIDFNAQVRPILFARCVSCHGPDAAAREGGLRLDTEEGSRAALPGGDAHAVVPGDLEGSELLFRVRDEDPAFRMPPPEKGDPLTSAEIAILERWIAEGGDYAPHWGFEPVRALASPPAKEHPIDHWVETRAREAGLPGIGPPAPRPALIRRLSLDLTGLPPTLEEVDAFLADTAPGAWERLVDRTLTSPSFGERWASVWLELARYADTKGYEADRGRTIWPWRDLLIRTLDADLPFAEFTERMLAGDLLPPTGDPEEDERRILASAFHRNTMTNDEGGTDDEEFRTAAVLDRVDTTMLAWMGLTAGCAQCHDHKYDPLSREEYYALAAFFNQTEDADRGDEAPTIPFATAEQRERRAALEAERAEAAAALVAATTRFELPPAPEVPTGEPVEAPLSLPVVQEGMTPPFAELRVDGRLEAWRWRPPTDASGGVAAVVETRGNDGQVTQVFFPRSLIERPITTEDRLEVRFWLDPEDPPETVMVQIHTRDEGWEHRVVWGEDRIENGVSGSESRRLLGALPPLGEWTTRSFTAAEIGLDPTDRLQGVAFTQRGGRVEWASLHQIGRHPPDLRPVHSLSAFTDLLRASPGAPVPERLKELARRGLSDLAPAERDELRAGFITAVHPAGRDAFRGADAETIRIGEELAQLERSVARVPVMRELPPERRRTTHVLTLGNFLQKEAEVTPAVPAAFHPFPADAPRDRLGLARWLVDDANPLTDRVQVNRTWERIFGRGLVETVEDLGTQGAVPSHPRLLDELVAVYRASDRRLKPLLRHIVTSRTYRATALMESEGRTIDPENRWLIRSSRTRLPAEMFRDQALAIGGILSPKKFGPPVFPPQPPGIWQVVYNGASWMESEGEDRRRRSLYTYWRRTSPYPSAMLFDAMSREVCSARRIRTDTPLQALVAMNDPVFVEAAGGLALRMLEAVPEDRGAALSHGFRRATARWPEAEERSLLEALLEGEREILAADPSRADALLRSAGVTAPEGVASAELAALVIAAQVILQLDEVWTRP